MFQSTRAQRLPFPVLIFIVIYLYMICSLRADSQIEFNSDKNILIKQVLTEVTDKGKAPGMVAAIISEKGVIALASAGERKAGSGIAFTTEDHVHLGSCTKAMTSTMIATLVAEGTLDWEMTLIEAIPELKGMIHSDYHKITLWQLLSHRGGLRKNAEDWDAYEQKEIKERRLAILKDNLKLSVAEKPDTFNYSNLGYMVAACMAEQITGLSWEELMKTRIFEPLGMTTAGFGAPGAPGQIDQPWGHKQNWFGYNWKSDQSDNPEALGPAGRVHCSIEDWARFLSLYLTDANPIIERRYLNKLIEAEDNYGGGWGVIKQPWAKGTTLVHNGSNGMWYASVTVAPELNRVFVVASNSCDFSTTPRICSEIMKTLLSEEVSPDRH